MDSSQTLRDALERIASGDEPRTVGKHWWPDNRVSKHDRCTHGVWMYETCGNCIAEFAKAALSATQAVDTDHVRRVLFFLDAGNIEAAREALISGMPHACPDRETISAIVKGAIEGTDHVSGAVDSLLALFTSPSSTRGVELEAAATDLLAGMSGTFKARNGRDKGIEAEDGEKCWIVHSDLIEALRRALPAKSPERRAGQ